MTERDSIAEQIIGTIAKYGSLPYARDPAAQQLLNLIVAALLLENAIHVDYVTVYHGDICIGLCKGPFDAPTPPP